LDFLSTRRMFNALVRRRAVAGRFLRETRADTAVEFAMIGAAFFLFIFVIFIFSLDMFWQMALDDAVRNATRQVQIGKITTDVQFKTQICSEFGAIAPNCMTSLKYLVQSNTSFSAMTPAVLNSAGTLVFSNAQTFSVQPSTTFTAANATQAAVLASPQFLLVQVAYLIPFKIMVVPAGVATENGTPALLSTVAGVME
jgi:hypothetical protein